MTRPPAFRLPPVNPIPLFLFFGHGDYVIARDAAEASVFWMDHFGELSYAREFEKIPDGEEIEIFIDSDEGYTEVMTREEIQSQQRLYNRASGSYVVRPDTWNAHFLVETFGPGYLASTTED